MNYVIAVFFGVIGWLSLVSFKPSPLMAYSLGWVLATFSLIIQKLWRDGAL